MKVNIYNLKAEKVDTLELPASIFGLKWNPDLIYQVVESMRSNLRAGTVKTKDRGEVSGGGRKPWRQKGTGRARHGSIRSPIWIGGGVTHGPTGNKKYFKKINKKARHKALMMILAKKITDGEVLFLDRVKLQETKTKKAAEVLRRLGQIAGLEGIANKGVNIILAAEDTNTAKAFRNIPGMKIIKAKNLNALEALSAKYLILGKGDAEDLVKGQNLL